MVLEKWPKADPKKMKEESVIIAVQINGKTRGEITIPMDAEEADVVDRVKKEPHIQKWIGDKELRKIIYIKNRLINIVI